MSVDVDADELPPGVAVAEDLPLFDGPGVDPVACERSALCVRRGEVVCGYGITMEGHRDRARSPERRERSRLHGPQLPIRAIRADRHRAGSLVTAGVTAFGVALLPRAEVELVDLEAAVHRRDALHDDVAVAECCRHTHLHRHTILIGPQVPGRAQLHPAADDI